MKKLYVLTLLSIALSFTSFAIGTVSGDATGCIGSGYDFSYSVDSAGGSWSSSNPAVASVNAGGTVRAISAGSTTITYTLPGGTYATAPFTAYPQPANISEPVVTFCAGSTSTCTDATSGGTWSSTDNTIASVNTTGVVTGISAGFVNIYYTLPGGCSVDKYDTVNATSTGSISGPADVNVSATAGMIYTGFTTSGIWSSSNNAIASISAGGAVTGISPGTDTIGYTLSTSCGAGTVTTIITVTPMDGIAGYVNFGSGVPGTDVEVWLITYNPATYDLEAVDSVIIPYSGLSSLYYSFTGLATDSFRVKAAQVSDTGTLSMGYVPTYHNSSFYWDSANVVYHISGSSDTGIDINMAHGIATSGPGFIGGNVTMGANKGTSISIPDVGLLVFALDATTGTLVKQAYTDASGNYTFSGLPLGTYNIYPEAINYGTTPYTNIALTSSSESMNSANFQQHTISKTITPVASGINTAGASAASAFTYPNPVSGKLNIQWNENSTEKSAVTITDVTGRVLYKTTINMNQGSGNKQIDLSAFTNGIYIVTIKSDNISYTNKIEVQH